MINNMQSLSKLLSLVLLCLLVAEVSNSADELPTITIGHMDLAEDIRYTDWNVHPVDIRSATAIIDHRAYAGAQLAAEELKGKFRPPGHKFDRKIPSHRLT